MTDETERETATSDQPEKQVKNLSPAAKRALEEAEIRRKQARKPDAPRELGGRGGKDPARYGDWEVKGIASDF